MIIIGFIILLLLILNHRIYLLKYFKKLIYKIVLGIIKHDIPVLKKQISKIKKEIIED